MSNLFLFFSNFTFYKSAKIILYLYSIFIFYFFLSLLSLREQKLLL